MTLTLAIMQSKFLTHLDAEIDELPYVLLAPLRYQSLLLQGIVWVPTGFKTDLYSIPWYLQNLIPRDGKANGAAVVHDLLYRLGAFRGKALTQKQCDQVLREAMICGGMPTWRRVLIYRGLRAGGWWTWRKYRRAQASPELAA